MRERRWLLYCGIIGVSFMWTGSAYMSQVYRLLRFYAPPQVDVISQILYYLMQVLGLAAHALLGKVFPRLAFGRRLFVGVIVAEAAVVPLAILAGSPLIVLGAGYVMNLLHGAVAGCYLAQLSALVPGRHRGKAFGIGYAVGSLGTWLISLPDGGKFLHRDGVVVVYWLLMGLTLLLLKFAADPVVGEETSDPGPVHALSLWITVSIAIILLTITRTVGFYFPLADISGIISLESSRAFYGLGLVVAGIINDRSRRQGAACGLIALIFPFIAIALNSEPSLVAVMWVLGYVFFGFAAVYRILPFADIAGRHRNLLPLAGMGLVSGRIGDILGTLGGVLCKSNTVSLLTVTGIAAVITIPFFLNIYQKLYLPAPTGELLQQVRLRRFENQHRLSLREREVLRMLILGSTNQEIADKLFVSESTVKFHVTNILKKTGCRNRGEVLVLFDRAEYH